MSCTLEQTPLHQDPYHNKQKKESKDLYALSFLRIFYGLLKGCVSFFKGFFYLGSEQRMSPRTGGVDRAKLCIQQTVPHSTRIQCILRYRKILLLRFMLCCTSLTVWTP
jgi:hypothetical protein